MHTRHAFPTCMASLHCVHVISPVSPQQQEQAGASTNVGASDSPPQKDVSSSSQKRVTLNPPLKAPVLRPVRNQSLDESSTYVTLRAQRQRRDARHASRPDVAVETHDAVFCVVATSALGAEFERDAAADQQHPGGDVIGRRGGRSTMRQTARRT